MGRADRLDVALLITSGLFALAHGAQNFPLFFDRFAFGLMAGLIVILVGGLEAGIALHILNNLLAFAVAIAFDQLDGALTVSEVSWWQLPGDDRRRTASSCCSCCSSRAGWGCATRPLRPAPEPRGRSGAVRPVSLSRRGHTCPDWWARERLCILDPRSARQPRTVAERDRSHGVWGNWQPDWFWSS